MQPLKLLATVAAVSKVAAKTQENVNTDADPYTFYEQADPEFAEDAKRNL